MSARKHRGFLCLPPIAEWFTRPKAPKRANSVPNPRQTPLLPPLAQVANSNQPPPPTQLPDLKEIRARNKMRVKTNITKDKLKYVTTYDAQTQDTFKFGCPVCLRYFNHILASSCCHNYICRLCIGEMAKKAKTTYNYVIRCVHCQTDEFKLEDVDLNSTVREYTDTPAKYRGARTADQVPVLSKVCIQFADISLSLRQQ